MHSPSFLILLILTWQIGSHPQRRYPDDLDRYVGILICKEGPLEGFRNLERPKHSLAELDSIDQSRLNGWYDLLRKGGDVVVRLAMSSDLNSWADHENEDWRQPFREYPEILEFQQRNVREWMSENKEHLDREYLR